MAKTKSTTHRHVLRPKSLVLGPQRGDGKESCGRRKTWWGWRQNRGPNLPSLARRVQHPEHSNDSENHLPGEDRPTASACEYPRPWVPHVSPSQGVIAAQPSLFILQDLSEIPLSARSLSWNCPPTTTNSALSCVWSPRNYKTGNSHRGLVLNPSCVSII